jgi:hypothetical protein
MGAWESPEPSGAGAEAGEAEGGGVGFARRAAPGKTRGGAGSAGTEGAAAEVRRGGTVTRLVEGCQREERGTGRRVMVGGAGAGGAVFRGAEGAVFGAAGAGGAEGAAGLAPGLAGAGAGTGGAGAGSPAFTRSPAAPATAPAPIRMERSVFTVCWRMRREVFASRARRGFSVFGSWPPA